MIGPMFPDKGEVFINDCTMKGPTSRYNEEPIEGSNQIRWFVWEYAKTVQELLARVLESGAMVSRPKMVLAMLCLQLLDAEVAIDGTHEVTAKLEKWPTCKNPTKV